MTDKEIIRLFLRRDEDAIKKAAEKYGDYCYTVVMRVINDPFDAQEILNDTWFAAWKTIPPEEPADLGAFLAKIARNIAVDRLRKIKSEKRGRGESALILEELDQCIQGSPGADVECIAAELSQKINGFIKKLPKRQRGMFVSRYTMSYSISEIAYAYGCSSNSVRAVLADARNKLKKYLEKEGLL